MRGLVEWHVDFALRHRSLIVVQDRDWESLPPEARERVRSLQREYVEVWAGQLRRVHRGLRADRARAMAHATFGLINSTPHSALLPSPQMRELLIGMALDALGVVPTGLALRRLTARECRSCRRCNGAVVTCSGHVTPSDGRR